MAAGPVFDDRAWVLERLQKHLERARQMRVIQNAELRNKFYLTPVGPRRKAPQIRRVSKG